MRFINDKFKRRDGHKDELINRIIDMEWSMFDQVVNMGGRAPCQDDEWTFYVMRASASLRLLMMRRCKVMSRIFWKYRRQGVI